MEVSLKMVSKLLDHNGLNLKDTELCLGLPGGGSNNSNSGGEMIETPKATGKRGFSEAVDLKLNLESKDTTSLNSIRNNGAKEKMLLQSSTIKNPANPPAKAQVVGWPPVRSYRKNMMAPQKNTNSKESGENGIGSSNGNGGGALVKVSMDGAPYLRKVDFKMYNSYKELSDALGNMFSTFTTCQNNYGAQGMIDFMNESKLMNLLNSSDYVPTYEDKDGDWMLVGDVPWEMFVDSCKRLRMMKGSEAVGLAPRAMEKCKNRS